MGKKKSKGGSEPEPEPEPGSEPASEPEPEAAAKSTDEAAEAATGDEAKLSKAELKQRAKEEKKRAEEEKKRAKEEGKKSKKKSGKKGEPEPEPEPEPELQPQPQPEPEPATGNAADVSATRQPAAQAPARPGRTPGRAPSPVDSSFVDDIPEAAPKRLSEEEEAARIAAIPRDTSPAKERALRDAAQRGLHGDCRTLLEAGVAVDGADASGFTPLVSAACHGHSEAVKVLLTYGASAVHVDGRGQGALHWAASQRQAQCCELLLEAAGGADMGILEARGGGAQLTPFLLSAKNQDFGCMELLVRARCDVTARSKHGDDASALLLAGRAGEEEGRLLAERLRLLATQVGAEVAQEQAAAALRAAGQRVFLSFREDEPEAASAAESLRLGLASR